MNIALSAHLDADAAIDEISANHVWTDEYSTHGALRLGGVRVIFHDPKAAHKAAAALAAMADAMDKKIANLDAPADVIEADANKADTALAPLDFGEKRDHPF